MTEDDRTGTRPARSAAVWIAAVLAALILPVAAMSPWASGASDLSRWRLPDTQVGWIIASSSLLPRYPVEGESVSGIRSLPLGDPSAVQVIHRFRLSALPTEPMAILLPAVDGQALVYANGVPIKENPEQATPLLSSPTARSRVWSLPRRHLHRGENRIDIVVASTAFRALASPVYIGPKVELEAAAQSGARASDIARRLVLVLSTFAAAASLTAVAFRAPGWNLAIAAALAATGTRVFLAGDPAALGLLWPGVDQGLVAAVAISAGLALRAQKASSKPFDLVEGGLLAIAALLAAACLLASGAGLRSGALIGALSVAIGMIYLLQQVILAASRATSASFGRKVITGMVVGFGVVAGVITVAGADGAAVLEPAYAADIALAAALAGLALLAATHATGEVVLRVGRLLRDRLDQTVVIARQQATLEATALALDAKSRQSAVLEERQRMARDVHDGIGGQLASLIAQVRLRRVTMDHVEQALVGGLSELRLLVDSLDVVGETLADALASFHDRARQQTSAADMTLEWSQPDDLGAEVRDQQWILNLYRLMQEAITNAVRHSGGDRVSVTVNSDGHVLIVQIRDNGDGFDPETVKRGRGTANMAHRAADLGGVATVGPAEGGRGSVVRVEATLPV